ncbi:MAG: bifunctional nuclease family protein [Bacteroidota bacterium]
MDRRILVDILGLTTSPSSGGAYALILRESEGVRRLPIIIGAFEAQSIALEMENIKPPRPLTHDLIKNIIDNTGATLSEVTINELRDGTFFAVLNMDGHEIDSRPSDAIALAVRFGVPIYVNEEVMSEAAFIPEDGSGQPATSQNPTFRPQGNRTLTLQQLQAKLNEAIAKEDYELAVKIRDEVRRMQAEQ